MTATATRLTPQIHDLLRDAARWRLLGLLFEPPGGTWRRDVAALVREVDDAELHGAAEAALTSATEGRYYSVFGPGGPAPPREVTYYESVELGSLMSELAGSYGVFGYRPATSEAPDHVAVEIGFLAYVRFKQAYAEAAGDGDRAAAAARMFEWFRGNHLAAFAAPLAALLTGSGIDYLVQAAALLAARAGSPPVRARLRIRAEPVEDEGSEFPCCDG